MWTWISLVEAAHAGACCVGATGAAPVVLGECEHAMVAVSGGPTLAVARWDSRAQLKPASIDEIGAQGTITGAVRWSRRAQVVLDAPVSWLERRSTERVERGGGLGDVGGRLLWDPLAEGDGPAPLFVLGARLPTGRDWKESDQVLQADVTGRRYAAIMGGVGLERTIGDVPWSVALSGRWPLGAEPSSLTASGMVGRYLGDHWTVSGVIAQEWTFAADQVAWHTVASARAVVGERLRWRAWAELSTDLPVPGLGLATPVTTRATLGAAWIH